MRLLFVHQNFPGQYRHLAEHFGAAAGNEVVAVGEKANLLRNRPQIPGVQVMGYTLEEKQFSGLEAPILKALHRAQAVAAGLADLRRRGFRPDVVLAHIGWGEAIFVKDVFPEAKLLLYSEFFYRAQGSDTDFDPEFPPSAGYRLRLRGMNAPLLMALEASDWGHVPTRWQHRQFPPAYGSRTTVVHDGIDTEEARPGEAPEAELITYVARNLEPYRGFHVFMRAIPEIQQRRPRARIVIVGGDEVSYSPRLPAGETYRARLLRELEGRIDLSRVQFTGRIPYGDYLRLLRRSSVHVYLTYPFVLSWSLLEAMSAGGLVVASRTAPVEEVIEDARNGLLVDFFSPKEIAARVDYAISNQKELQPVREAARRTVMERYDLHQVCLPAQVRLITQLAAGLPISLGEPGPEADHGDNKRQQQEKNEAPV
jgi:glycosyltransferase involved in cell wall biosynthesis